MNISRRARGGKDELFVRLFNDGSDDSGPPFPSPISDDDLLDNYFRTVSNVVETVKPGLRHTEKLELFVTPEEWVPSARRN